MTRLVLVAAGGLARETLAAVEARGEISVSRDVVVLDDDPTRHGTGCGSAPVVGGLSDVERHPQAEVLVCAGRGLVRRVLVERLTVLGVGSERYATVVHPSAVVAPGCRVGAGSILLAGVVLTADVRVGRHVVAMPHVTLTHDDVVEDFATLAAGVSLAGGVHVGEAASVGTNASVREGLTIGAGGTLGMGAALLTDLPHGETWVGVPAARSASPTDGVR